MKLIRIIPLLLINNNFLLKGENFKNHKYIGDVYNAVKIFSEKRAHEIILLDIFARREKRTINFDLIKKIRKEIFVPLCVGGGFSNADQVDRFFSEGVEKVSINSELQNGTSIIEKISNKFGSQSTVVSIDVKKIEGEYKVFFENGEKKTDIKIDKYLKDLENAGAGEVILTSIDNEGERNGFNLDLYNQIKNLVNIPIIASGGAKNINSMDLLFEKTDIASCAVGSSFVFFGERKAVLLNYPTGDQIEKIFNKYE